MEVFASSEALSNPGLLLYNGSTETLTCLHKCNVMQTMAKFSKSVLKLPVLCLELLQPRVCHVEGSSGFLCSCLLSS